MPTNKWKDAERPPDLGPGYRLWWEEYYQMHHKFMEFEDEKEEYGGVHKGPGVTPQTHAWLMRYTAGEYVLPLWTPPKGRKVCAGPGRAPGRSPGGSARSRERYPSRNRDGTPQSAGSFFRNEIFLFFFCIWDDRRSSVAGFV